MRMQFLGSWMVFTIEARGSRHPGEYRLNRVNVVVFVWYVDLIVVPGNELPDVKVIVAVRLCVCLMYVAHLGCVGIGVNRSKFGKEGGLPCLSHHGSCMKQIRFSGFLENSCNAEIVIAWPRAQFSSCTDPTDAGRAIYWATTTMGASPWLVVDLVMIRNVRSLMRSGHLGSLALWGLSQFAYRIGGWVQGGPFLQINVSFLDIARE